MKSFDLLAARRVPAYALALLFVACGDDGSGSKVAPAGQAPTAVAEVDPHDPIAVEKALSSLGYAAVDLLSEDFEVDRAAAPAVALIYPRGEVRKAGLRTYRIDVNLAQLDGDATLSFVSGGKTLHEQPFVPARIVRAPLPAAVLARLDAGDKVTWGLATKGPKKREYLATFEIVPGKPALEKKLARIDADAHFKASPLLRDLERARVLGDYQLDAEVVEILTQVADKDPEIVSVHADILRSLRRLRLQEAPLFREEQKRTVAVRGFVRPGGGDPLDAGMAGGVARGPAPYRAPVDPAPSMAPLGAGGGVAGRPTDGATAPKGDEPAVPDAPGAVAPAQAPFRVRAERVAAQLRQAAEERALLAGKAGEAAREAAREADAATRAADDAAKAAEQARRDAEALPAGSPGREAADRAAAQALELAAKAGHEAEAKREEADARQKASELAAKRAADAGLLGKLVPDGGPVPPAGAPADAGAAQVEQLRKVAFEAAQQAEAAQGAIRGAQAGVDAAKAALEAAAGDPPAVATATADLERRLRALDDAKAESERLDRVAQEASDLAAKGQAGR